MKRCFVLGGVFFGMIATSAVHAEEDFFWFDSAGVFGGLGYVNTMCSHKFVSYDSEGEIPGAGVVSFVGEKFPTKRGQTGAFTLGGYGRLRFSRCWFADVEIGLNTPFKHDGGVKHSVVSCSDSQFGYMDSFDNRGAKLVTIGSEPYLQVVPFYLLNTEGRGVGVLVGASYARWKIKCPFLKEENDRASALLVKVGGRYIEPLNDKSSLRLDLGVSFSPKKIKKWHKIAGVDGDDDLDVLQRSEMRCVKYQACVTLQYKIM